MIVSEHIDADHALSLVALAPDDPERQRALAHAATCDTCRALLEEGTQLLALLDQGLAELPVLDPAFATRVHAEVHGRSPSWQWLMLPLGAVVTLAIAWLALQHTGREATHHGVRCFMFEQGFAAFAFGVGALYARQLAGRLSALQWATIAMSGALAGQALLLLRCNANGAALHILGSHVLGVACATVLGALLGRRVRAAAA
jgi:hypothetical protein